MHYNTDTSHTSILLTSPDLPPAAWTGCSEWPPSAAPASAAVHSCTPLHRLRLLLHHRPQTHPQTH